MRPNIDSSPTTPLETSFFVVQNGATTGPIQLPDNDEAEFVRLFNQTYGDLGMQIQRSSNHQPMSELANESNEKNVGLFERIRRFIVSVFL